MEMRDRHQRPLDVDVDGEDRDGEMKERERERERDRETAMTVAGVKWSRSFALLGPSIVTRTAA